MDRHRGSVRSVIEGRLRRAEERRPEIIVTDKALAGVEEEEALAGTGKPVRAGTKTPRSRSGTKAGRNGHGTIRTPHRPAGRKPTRQEAKPEKNGHD